MPTYEYECEKCQKHFEIFQSMKDQALTECPASHCQMEAWGHGKVKRLLGTGAGLIFKGSGFYITDYRSQGYQEAAKKEKGEKKPAQKEAPPQSGSPTKPKPADK
ncbi:MAG: FmdB family transcriptional regulator [Verrucomicrobia bacterium]|nr:MAG: FmdB family transcriptional regulator [Verrucomicrobiota bacterium]